MQTDTRKPGMSREGRVRQHGASAAIHREASGGAAVAREGNRGQASILDSLGVAQQNASLCHATFRAQYTRALYFSIFGHWACEKAQIFRE